MISLTSGIPQSAANPLIGILTGDDERRAKENAWRLKATDALDQAVLDYDGFIKGKPAPPLDFAADPDTARKQGIVASYLQIQAGGRPISTDPVQLSILRDRVADQQFAGRGKGDDLAFYGEIEKETTGRHQARVFFQDLAKSAAQSALMAAAGEPAAEYPAWMAEARQRPGYRKDLETAYLTEWRQRQRELKQQLDPVRDLVARQWQAMKEGKTADLEGLEGYMANEESREVLLYAIGGLVKALPKEQQPSVLANLRKQFLRRDLPANLEGIQRSMRPFDRDQTLPDDYLDRLEPGTNLEAFEKRKRAEFERDSRARDRFLRKLESIVNDEYDPIVTHAKEGSNWASFEKGLYAFPGVALTVGVNLIPGAGQFASYEILRQDSTDQARAALIQGGMDEDRADLVAADIGTVSGLIQLPMERLGLAAFTNRLPFINRAVNRITTGLATRYLARAGSSAAVEFTTEMGQNLVPSIIQDIAAAASQDIPETQWTDEGGVFQDYDKQSLEVLGAILPLSLIMAGGGVFRDQRIQTVAAADDLTLRAAGMSDAAIQSLRAATGIAEQEVALETAWQSRDINSPDAQAAQQELTARVQAEQSTAASASDNGIMPRAVRATDGTWTLYDTATGSEIGQAPDWQRAAQLATTHANFTADQDADRIALVFSTYQAAEVSGQWGTDTNRPTAINLDLGRQLTAQQAAAESSSARERVAAQERLMGGDGSVTNVVLGQSRTELAQGQLRTVNRILEGGSVLDVFHEETHGFRRQAHARGILTREDDLAFVSAVNTVLQGQTTREGAPLQLLPADFATLSETDQETALDEAISAIAEAEVVRTRKGGGQRSLPAGLVSNNLSALARLLGDRTLGKFRSFIAAIREYFGLAIDRAAQIQRGLADGTLDRATYEGYLAKLLGVDEQIDYDQMARDAESAILDGAELSSDPLQLEGDPFSLGQRTTVTPIASTRAFPGAEGSPSVIGPASFSIRAHHGTPHKVDKFTTGKIGTGEGAQAYGWGLYFAADETVARYYRDTLVATDSTFTKSAAWWLGNAGGDYDQAIADIKEQISTLQDGRMKTAKLAALAELEKRDLPAGNLYTVTLKVEDDQLLDWDKPLSQQGDTVKAAVEAVREFYGKGNTLAGDMRGGQFYALFSGTDFAGNPAAASAELLAAGIRGIRYLDGNSRAQGEGTANFVAFSEADIEILEENGQPVAPSFSLGSRRLSVLTQDSIRRIQNPLRRVQAMERVSRKLEDLRLEAERLELLSGTKRLKRSLAREAAIRQALRREELENEAWARHAAILSDDDLTKLRAQPGHAALADPSSPLRGRLLSRTAAAKKHPDLFQLHQNPAEYEGSERVSRTLFGGTLTPDLAAEELFAAGLLREASTDALWQLLESEARHVASMKKVLEAAKADLREARTVAKAETNAWLATQVDTQATVYSPRQEILRSLAALDAILSSVPAEIRGKVGGYVQAARIADPDAGLQFLRERLAKTDAELEKYLKSQYNLEFLALLDRARPEKDEAGKRPRGKIGADVHALFADLREAMTLTAAETEAEATRLEILAEQEDLTPEQQSHAMLQANLVRLVGDWPRATAARREAAVLEATRVFESGYMEEKIRMSRQREDRAKKRTNLAAATGKAGTREERRVRAQRDEGTRTGRVLKAGLSLMSFEQVVQKAFGEGTADAEALVDWERRAAHAKADALQNKLDLLEDLFASLAGGKLKGEQLRFQMSDAKGITATDAKGRTHTFSQLEAITATLMWRQEDGRRHMEGHVDDQGAPAGEWNFTQDFVDQLEDQLTDNAKAIRLHLAQQYAAEYQRLNSVFRQLYGVSLPRHAHYSPLTVKPAQAGAGQTLDPVTGSTMTGAGLTPGALKTRSQTAIAEPDFRDALQTYIGHSKQMEHWIAYAPFATEAMALINARNVGNSVEAAAGKETLQTLRGWLDVFAQGGTRDAAAHLAANQLLNRMIGRAAATALVGRVSVLAIQSTQLGAALAEMPAGAYITRLARLFAGRLDWSAALRSDYIQRRKAQMPPVVQQALEGLSSSKPSRLKYLARKMGETISGADALFTAGTFAITYDYHLKQAQQMGIADPQAYARQAAERSTDRVAQPTRTGTRSLYEVTGTNPAVRIVWSFASEPRQKLMLAAYAFSSKKSKGAKARALAVAWLAGGLVASVIRATMRDIRDDDDDEIFDEKNWDPKRLALSSLTGPFAGIPFLGDALEATAFGIAGEYLPDGNLFSNAPKALERTADLLMGDHPEDLEEAVKDAETILSGAGLFSDSAAATASFSHLLRDLVNIVENATGTD